MSFAGHQFRYASLPPVSLAVNGGKGHIIVICQFENHGGMNCFGFYRD